MMPAVGVVGASGFIGSAIVRELGERGLRVVRIDAPRLSVTVDALDGLLAVAERHPAVDALAKGLHGIDVLVNAAGIADAGSALTPALVGANALLPPVLWLAGHQRDVRRFVHVSSAAVQGRRPVLDETAEVEPFSPYSWSKALGEQALTCLGGEITCYRPTSVHGASRSTTRSLASFARSSLRSVAGRGDRPTPQVLLENVASGIVRVAVSDVSPPNVVLHPWEGLTCAAVLTHLGGRPPRRLPSALARQAVDVAYKIPSAVAKARRLEMLWFGQPQSSGWLAAQDWEPPKGPDAWIRLGRELMGGHSDE